MRGAVLTGIVFVAACLEAGAGLGSTPPNKEQIRLDPRDQAAARATVLRRADLGSSGWTGGRRKPDLSSTPSCPGYTPKQSDLVVTGAAESDFQRPGLQVRSIAEVLKTRAMVARDWRRSVRDPRALRCFRHMTAEGLSANERLLSFRRIAFPRLARYTAAFRALIEVRALGQRVPVVVDVVLGGRSRTELTLTLAAPASARAGLPRAEVRLMRRLLARARA